MFWKRNVRQLTLLSGLLVLINLVYTATLQAIPYGTGTYGSCQYGTCEITLTSSGTVNLSVTPTPAGVYSTINDDVEVETRSSTGYTLTMKDSDTNTNLVNGGETFARSAGTPASPITLAANTWGYRIDNVSGFGPGPTAQQNSVSSSGYTFAGVPASNETAHTLAITSGPADPAETTQVWYGVHANADKPEGTYVDQVTYTAVIND